MPRLFVAMDLPAEVKRLLRSLQPPAAKHVLLTPEDQLHLTLHFLGERSVDDVDAALQQVAFEPIRMQVTGLGHFTGQHRDTILWAGIARTAELKALHAGIATALAPVGFQSESRPWHPHITLARCQGQQPEVISIYLNQPSPAWPSFTAEEFHLYSSVLQPGGSVYRLEGSYPSSRLIRS
jgi:2'-5' RNA ligase